MKNQQSIEDYLETIFVLLNSASEVHRADVARRLGVSQPAVTKSINKLREQGLVTLDGMHIELTASGKARAREIYGKHCDVKAFLVKLGVSESDAEYDACQIEHVISDATYSAIKNFIK